MVNKCWREQVEEGEQKSREAKIGTVFLIDRGETQPTFFFPISGQHAELHFILSNVSSQMWTMSLLCAHKSFTKDL